MGVIFDVFCKGIGVIFSVYWNRMEVNVQDSTFCLKRNCLLENKATRKKKSQQTSTEVIRLNNIETH